MIRSEESITPKFSKNSDKVDIILAELKLLGYYNDSFYKETSNYIFYKLLSAKNIDCVLKIYKGDQTDFSHTKVFEPAVIKYIKKNISKTSSNLLPKILHKGNSPLCYFVYKYVDGEPWGDITQGFGVSFGLLNDDNVKSLCKLTQEIENIDKVVDDIKLPSYGNYKLDAELDFICNQKLVGIDKELVKAGIRYIKDNQKLIYRKRVVSHFDFYTNNILNINNNKNKFVLIDWESTCNVAEGYSFAFLYLMLWREEYWKYKLFSNFYNYYYNKYDKYSDWVALSKTFRLFVILLSIRFIIQIQENVKNTNYSSNQQNAIKTFTNEIRLALTGHILVPKSLKYVICSSDVLRICKSFGFESFDEYKMYYVGHGNALIRVKIGSDYYIIRIYAASRKLNLVKREIKIFNLLRANNINTYIVYKTVDKQEILNQKFYGLNRNIVFLSYLKGTRILTRWSGERSSYLLGKLLRKIHDANVTHGDFSKENILFNKSEPISVLDLEWGRITKRKSDKEYDLAHAITLWTVDSRYKNISDSDFIYHFLNGYYNYKLSNDRLIEVYKLIRKAIINEAKKVTVDKKVEGHNRFDKPVNMLTELIENKLN